jgi:Ca2+-binding RTX toxin-like protein
MTSRTRAGLLALGAVAALAAVPVPSASAAPCYGDCKPGVARLVGDSFRYDAPVGVNDQMTITISGGVLTLTDPPSIFGAGDGCTMVTPHEVRCTAPLFTTLLVRGLDGDDVITNATSVGSRIDGGLGSDRLNGGSGDDRLIGGFGADVLNGGGGSDTAVYSENAGRTAVHADLDGATGDDGGPEDGPAGARDTIAADVENLEGTIRDDVLIGNAGPNVISGTGGHDLIQGLGGADQLTGRGGGTVDGGAGTDVCISDLTGLPEQPDTFLGCETTHVVNN